MNTDEFIKWLQGEIYWTKKHINAGGNNNPFHMGALKAFDSAYKKFTTMGAKPIAIVKVNPDGLYDFRQSMLLDFQKLLSERMQDYHVFCILQSDTEQPHDLLEFQVFYEKDHVPIDYEGLKELVLSSQHVENQTDPDNQKSFTNGLT